MTDKDDWAFVNRILESANLVLSSHFSAHSESPERIDELFRQIQEDYRKFNECKLGEEVKSRVDQDVPARFQMALLVLSYGARKNKQALLPAPALFPDFSHEELGVYDILKRFDLLDTYSANELRQKLIDGDPSVESFFKEYRDIKESLDQLVSQTDIRPGIRHYLKNRGDYYTKKCEAAFGSVGGQFIVPTSYARHRELDFIGRIKSNLESNRKQITFLGTGFTVDKIVVGHDFIRRSQKSGSSDRHTYWIKNNLPKNDYISAVLTEKTLAFHKKSFIFYAVFAAHIEQYSGYGYDSRPLELREIMGYLDTLPKNTRESGHHILFCIASPTGFEDSVLSASDTNVLDSVKFPDVSICFFDLNTNKKFFNRGDRISAALAGLCDLETDGEKNVKLKEILYGEMDHRFLVDQSVSLAHVTKFSNDHGFPDAERVKKVFYHYAREKNLIVRDIPETGPVMMKKR
jgi:hypothetical protein